MRFETGPGEQAQVDWGSTAIYLGEERVRIHIFTMVLGYSRRISLGHIGRRGWILFWTATRRRSGIFTMFIA